MNATAETLVKTAEENVEAAREESEAVPDAALIELGKVSDTRGGWFGSKIDSGMGFITY